jgi:hypothetical protein
MLFPYIVGAFVLKFIVCPPFTVNPPDEIVIPFAVKLEETEAAPVTINELVFPLIGPVTDNPPAATEIPPVVTEIPFAVKLDVTAVVPETIRFVDIAAFPVTTNVLEPLVVPETDNPLEEMVIPFAVKLEDIATVPLTSSVDTAAVVFPMLKFL